MADLPAALDLIPLQVREKPPRDKHWTTKSYSREEVEQWHAAGGNVGARLGDLDLVIDYDPRRDLIGDSLERLARDTRTDFATWPTTRTPSGGLHLFGRKPAELRVRGNDLPDYPGVEVKSRGRQVLVAPSIHPDYHDGPLYRRDESRPDYSEAPEATEALLKLVCRPPRKKRERTGDPDLTAGWLEKILDAIPAECFAGNDAWEPFMMGCVAACGADPECQEVFVAWSLTDPTYAGDEDEIRARWDSVDPEGERGPGTFFHLAGEALGGMDKIPSRPPHEILAAFGALPEPCESAPPPSRPPLSGAGLTDTGNAARFAIDHVNRVRFVEELEQWVAWDGRRWAPDLGLTAERLARDTVRRMEREAAAIANDEARSRALKWALQSYSARSLAAMVRIARADLSVSVRDLDAHPDLLNVANGVLDLCTGELNPHDPALLLTKLAPVEYRPDARCERWEAFLREVLPDESVRECFQRFTGYALGGGGQKAKRFGIVIGLKDSGKSTALGAIADTLGSDASEGGGVVSRAYVATATMDAFARGRGNSPELARLAGVRMVIVNEIPEGKALESSTVKAWTGNDVVNATPKYGHPLSFRPDGKLVLVGNVMPGIDFSDDAMWERVLVLPFGVSIPEERQDRGLRERFDRASILAWLVAGYRLYREGGLKVPDACRLAREARRDEADPLVEFWEAVVEREGAWLTTGSLFSAYRLWASSVGLRDRDRLSQRALTPKAIRRFGKLSKREGVDGWRGLAVRAEIGD